MADQKISQLTELATVPAVDDELVIVDKSDTTMAASGTDKRIQHKNIFPSYGTSYGPPSSVGPLASTATGATNTYYAIRLMVLSTVTITGIRYRVGATSNGNVRSALYNGSGGTRLADRTTDLAMGTANAQQAVAFDSPIAVTPDLYCVLIWFSSATATTFAGRFLVPVATGTNVGGTPTTITVNIANSDVPAIHTY